MAEPQTEYVLDVEAVTRESAGEARAWTEDVLTHLASAPEPEAVVETAKLAVSELITNVFLHAGGPARLTLTLFDGAVEIATADKHNGGFPDPAALAEADPTDEHHRGLALINRMTGPITVRAAAGWAKEIAVLVSEGVEF